MPSAGCVKMCRVTERFIRHCTLRNAREAPSVQRVQAAVKRELAGGDVFELSDHAQDTQFGIDNHVDGLTNTVITLYQRVRMHHVARLNTSKLQEGNARKRLNHLVLFKGPAVESVHSLMVQISSA